jgi:hypothetical protein
MYLIRASLAEVDSEADRASAATAKIFARTERYWKGRSSDLSKIPPLPNLIGGDVL